MSRKSRQGRDGFSSARRRFSEQQSFSALQVLHQPGGGAFDGAGAFVSVGGLGPAVQERLQGHRLARTEGGALQHAGGGAERRTGGGVRQVRRAAWTAEAHGPVDLKFRIDEKWRDDLLRTYLDERDRCEALTPADLDRRYDWASLALARHDRDTTLRLASFGSLAPNASERVREPDRLADLQRQLVTELDRLVDAGDVEAMSREAYLFRNPTSTVIDVPDPVRSYAIGYAMSLAAGGNDDAAKGAASTMSEAAKSLSPEAVEQARREGEALYARCCRNGLVFH